MKQTFEHLAPKRTFTPHVPHHDSSSGDMRTPAALHGPQTTKYGWEWHKMWIFTRKEALGCMTLACFDLPASMLNHIRAEISGLYMRVARPVPSPHSALAAVVEGAMRAYNDSVWAMRNHVSQREAVSDVYRKRDMLALKLTVPEESARRRLRSLTRDCPTQRARIGDTDSGRPDCRLFGVLAIVKFGGMGTVLNLLLSRSKASAMYQMSHIRANLMGSLPHCFARLPRELREMIYVFVLADEDRYVDHPQTERCVAFVRCLGDPSGFLSHVRDCSSLHLCKALRAEMLAVAYRETSYVAEDVEHAIQLLLTIGTIGRANIRSLEIQWESQIDLDHGKTPSTGSNAASITMPSRHAALCIELLRRCKRLHRMKIKFDSAILADDPLEEFQADRSINLLLSMRHLAHVDVVDTLGDPIDSRQAKWLEGELQSRRIC